MWWRGQHCRERWENVQLSSMWSFSIILHKRSDQIRSGVWFCTMKLLTAVFFAAAYWINEINRRERTSEVDLYTGEYTSQNSEGDARWMGPTAYPLWMVGEEAGSWVRFRRGRGQWLLRSASCGRVRPTPTGSSRAPGLGQGWWS